MNRFITAIPKTLIAAPPLFQTALLLTVANLGLVSRFRSSHHYAARSLANFGIKGTLAIYDSSAVFGFEVPTQTRGYNDRNFKFSALSVAVQKSALARAAAILGGKSSRFHDPGPARCLCLDIGHELRPGFAGDLVALGFELAAHGGVGVRRFRRFREARNDVGRRALLDQQAEPHPRRELGIAQLGEGRDVLHRRPAFGTGDAERLELAGGVLWRRRVDLRETEQRVPGDQAGHLQS